MVNQKKFFSDKFIVVGDEKLFDFPDFKKFIFTTNQGDAVIKGNRRFGNKIIQINFTGSLENALQITKTENQIIKIFPDSEKEIIRQAKPLKEKNFFVCPEYPVKKVEQVSLITSMGLVVDLIYFIDRMDTSLAIEILDFYLHSRPLKTPIEPFHSILLSKIRQLNTSLWNMNLMNPKLFFYSDGHGLSESPEALGKKEYQFLIDNKTKNIRRVNQISRMDNFYRSLPRKHPECLACPHFHLCFSWAVFKKNSCKKWKKILNLLQEACREIQALEKFDREHPIISSRKA